MRKSTHNSGCIPWDDYDDLEIVLVSSSSLFLNFRVAYWALKKAPTGNESARDSGTRARDLAIMAEQIMCGWKFQDEIELFEIRHTRDELAWLTSCGWNCSKAYFFVFK